MFDAMSRLLLAATVLLVISASATADPSVTSAAPSDDAGGASASKAALEAAEQQAASDAAGDPFCVRRINERAREANVTEPIELDVRETDPVLNFGDGRGTLYDYVVLKASKPIPAGVPSSSFEIDSLEPMRRIGSEGLESSRLRVPTFSRPHFFNHRKEIGFSLCVTAASGEPGTYTGKFLFVGPGEIDSAAITQTAQLKSKEWKFLVALIVVLLVTFAFLGVKAFAEFEGEAEPREVAVKITLLLAAVAAAGIAMYLVYDKSPTWGDDFAVDAAALIATAFTAAGLGNTLVAGTGRISDSLAKAKATRKALKSGSGGEDQGGKPA